MAKISLVQVRKRYGNFEAIPPLDLEIEHGELCVFVGPSGCGKSTLLRTIVGLEELSGGEIFIGDREVGQLSPGDRALAMVFQNYALYPHMTVAENIGYPLKLSRMPKAEAKAKVEAVATQLGLSDLLARKPAALSGGQRQRVAIGRAIVREPEAFLFDEPLSNLDAELRVRMRLEIADLQRRIGATMIYVTHDQVEAMTLADKIVVLRDGRIEQAGAPLTLYDDPQNLFVARFIGSPAMNLLDTRPDGEGALIVPRLGNLRVAMPAGLSAQPGMLLGARPEHMTLDDADGTLQVAAVEQLGGTSYAYGEALDDQRICVELGERRGIAPGQTLSIGIRPDRFFLFDEESGRRLH